MGTKMAVAFANIFMSAIKKEIIDKSPHKPLVYKRFIDQTYSHCGIYTKKKYTHLSN